MPLVFTNPALLMGVLAGAIPVIIHFLSRRKVQRQKFSDLRFLDEVQAKQARSLGIWRWLLLLLRVLAILLIALGVAGPRWGGLIASGSGDRSVLFVVDNSASMNTQTGQGTRLDQALNACGSMIGSLPDNTTIQIITAGSRTEPLFGDWLPAGAGALRGLGAVLPTEGSFDPGAVMREAALQVARAPSAQVEMIWVSDLQEFPDAAEFALAAQVLQDAGTVRHLVRQVGQAAAGGGVLNVQLPGRSLHPGENVTLSALVTSQFDDEVFVLEIGGRPVAEAVVPRATSTAVPISFALPVPEAGLHRGRVSKESDVFPGDDTRPFVLDVPETLGVLLVHGPDRSVDAAAGRGGWRYLAEALDPGGTQGLFRVTTMESSQLTTGDLARTQVAVFVNPDPLGRRALEGLISWLRTGGAALFLLGEPTQAGYIGGSLLPAMGLTGNVTYEGGDQDHPQQQRPRIIDAQHPVFAGLEADALATMEDVLWQRWFRLEPGSGQVLMALTDESPLMIATTLEEGRIVVLPFDLTGSGNGLVTSPMALPFFQRLASWLAGQGSLGAAVNTEVGRRARVVPLAQGADDLLERTEDLVVLGEDGQGERSASLVWQGHTPLLVGDIIDRAGFTAFVAAGDTVGLVAAAVPAAESNLSLWSIESWETVIQVWGLVLSVDLTAGQGDDLAEVLAGTELAPWFFFLAIFLLLLELLVGRGTSAPKPISG